MFPVIFGLMIIFFIAWLIGIIRETHEKTLAIERKLEKIEKILEDFNYKK